MSDTERQFTPAEDVDVNADPNEKYLENFRAYLDQNKPAFDSIARSEWYASQPGPAQEHLKLEYWEWAKKQPEFKDIDQKAYKDYIFDQGALTQLGRAIGGAFMSGVGGGGELLGKIIQLSKNTPSPATILPTIAMDPR